MTSMNHTFHPTILREYDIRGKVGKTLHTEDAYALGQRFANYVQQKGGKICVVGRDGRLSSIDLADSLCSGLLSAGIDVIDVGLGPTPYLYFAMHELRADAGIMVTGSHNPAEDNGFKMIIKTGPIMGEDIKEIAAIKPITSIKPGKRNQKSVLHEYEDRLLKDLLQPKDDFLRIAWDAGHGAAGSLVEMLTESIPGEHFLLNTTIDGTFPAHPPDPTIRENLQELINKVMHEECDLGIAFDGDGDRLGVVDSHGRMIYGDQLLAIMAQQVLRDKPGSVVIGDVKASKVLFSEIERLGGKPVMSRTGHSLIKAKMKETGAILAGEVSGHFFFADKYFGYDDGLYAAIRLISYLHESGQTLADLYDALPMTLTTPELQIKVTDEGKFSLVDRVRENLKQVDAKFIDIDGVRVTTEDGWWLLRASNTSPILVARCESDSQEGLNSLQRDLYGNLSKVGIEIS